MPLYHLSTQALYPFAHAAWVIARLKDSRTDFGERLGFYRDTAAPSPGSKRVWIHAASAGEVNAVLPLIELLRSKRNNLHLTLTTTSLSGRRQALEKSGADRVHLAPLDMPNVLARAFDSIRPDLLVVAETEFWPLWLLTARDRGVKTLLVNGRVSDKSYPVYRFFKSLFREALASFECCLMQTEIDRLRVLSLGARPGTVEVAGQMKYDLSPPKKDGIRAFASACGITGRDEVVSLGSLREGEDEDFLKLLPEWLGRNPRIRVILGPRHFKRMGLYEEALNRSGQPWALRSKDPFLTPWRVLVLDSLGELTLAYAVSYAAFVGGTLVPVGGHNIMEPALSAVPVVYGPFLANVREAARALQTSGGGFSEASAGAVLDRMENLRGDVGEAAGQKALAAVESLRGATARMADRILAKLS